MAVIPQDFETWKSCIERKCGIPLTADYIQARLSVYEDLTHPECKRFVQLYGGEHRHRVKEWFRRAGEEITIDKIKE